MRHLIDLPLKTVLMARITLHSFNYSKPLDPTDWAIEVWGSLQSSGLRLMGYSMHQSVKLVVAVYIYCSTMCLLTFFKVLGILYQRNRENYVVDLRSPLSSSSTIMLYYFHTMNWEDSGLLMEAAILLQYFCSKTALQCPPLPRKWHIHWPHSRWCDGSS